MDPLKKRQFKDEVFAQFARVGHALSSGRRLEIIDLLAQSERTVEDLAREAGMSIANTSQHLQVLRRVRLVESRQEGTYVYYRLAGDEAFRLFQALRSFGEESLADVRRIIDDYLEHRDDMEPVRMDELLDRARDGRVIVLDVRPRREFEAGHIAGARSMPIDELEKRLHEIPADAEVVAYCRGPYCVFADEAAQRLQERGIAARRLDVGYPDWKLAGHPVEHAGDT